METPLPTAEKLKSLNVEESRTKRLERQQARLRDRGGIFRPENRNNNLFDILVQATHRKSPVKVRGRSRSRSVSPKKKATTTLSSSKKKSSTRPKSAAAGMDVISEVPEDATDLQPRSKKSNGKQRQTSHVNEDEDHTTTERDSGSKKSAPVKKKGTAKAPRQTKKKTIIHEKPEEQPVPAKAKESKPKGRRRKDDDQDEIVKIPAPRAKKPKSTKSKAVPQATVDDVSKVDEPTTSKQKKSAPANKPVAMDSTSDGIPLKIGPPKKRKPRSTQPENPPADPLPPPPPASKPKSAKRKAEAEDIDPELQARSTKRRAPSKPRSGIVADKGATKAKARNPASVESGSTNQVLVNAINRSGEAPRLDKDTAGPSAPKRNSVKKTKATVSEEASTSRSGHQSRDVDTQKAPKAGEKRSRSDVRVDQADDAGSAPKKPRTKESSNDVLQPKATSVTENNEGSLNFESSKETGKDAEQENRPPKTVSRKRKENVNARKPPKTTTASKNKSRSKNASCIPAHVREKLDAQHDNFPDDETDPIDFLS